MQVGVPLFTFSTAYIGSTEDVKELDLPATFRSNSQEYYAFSTADYITASYIEVDEHALEVILHDEANEFGVLGGRYDSLNECEVLDVYPYTAIFKETKSKLSGFPITRLSGRADYASPSYKVEDLYIRKDDIGMLETQTKNTNVHKRLQNNNSYSETAKDDNLKEIHEASIDFLISLIQQDAKNGSLKEACNLTSFLTKEGKFKSNSFAKEICKDSNFYFSNERGFSDETIRKAIASIIAKYKK